MNSDNLYLKEVFELAKLVPEWDLFTREHVHNPSGFCGFIKGLKIETTIGLLTEIGGGSSKSKDGEPEASYELFVSINEGKTTLRYDEWLSWKAKRVGYVKRIYDLSKKGYEETLKKREEKRKGERREKISELRKLISEGGPE